MPGWIGPALALGGGALNYFSQRQQNRAQERAWRRQLAAVQNALSTGNVGKIQEDFLAQDAPFIASTVADSNRTAQALSQGIAGQAALSRNPLAAALAAASAQGINLQNQQLQNQMRVERRREAVGFAQGQAQGILGVGQQPVGPSALGAGFQGAANTYGAYQNQQFSNRYANWLMGQQQPIQGQPFISQGFGPPATPPAVALPPAPNRMAGFTGLRGPY